MSQGPRDVGPPEPRGLVHGQGAPAEARPGGDRPDQEAGAPGGPAGGAEPAGSQSGAGEVYAVPDPAVFTPITIYEDLCIGCNLCVFVCQADLFLPSAVKGGAPLVVYGAECWYEGSCVDYCPVPGAIELNSPLVNRVQWK